MWPEVLPAARKIAPVTSESRELGHAVQYVKLQVWTTRCLFDARLADGNRVHAVLGSLASPDTCISLAMVWGPEGVVAQLGGPAV